MGKLSFRTSADKQGRIEGVEIGGLLVLETAIELKNELLGIADRLNIKTKISFLELEEMDLSCVQLLVAFIRHMDKIKVEFQIDWNLNEEQRALFVNVGIENELFMNK